MEYGDDDWFGIDLLSKKVYKTLGLLTTWIFSRWFPLTSSIGKDPAMSVTQEFNIKDMSAKASEASKNLPTLPIPPLEDTCRRYLLALEGLQEADEHARTKKAVEDFLKGDGPRIQARLKSWAANKAR